MVGIILLPMDSEYPVDYIIYADELGDHGLKKVDPKYPVFVLALCIFKVSDYVEEVVPSIQGFKFRYFKHDMIVLHEREIRKSLGPFRLLFDANVREHFMKDLSLLLAGSKFEISSCLVDKEKFQRRKKAETEIYGLAVRETLGAILQHLELNPGHQKIPVIFESRGNTEDRQLASAFDIRSTSSGQGIADFFELIIAEKLVNSSGLQIADMVVRPIGQHWLRPGQSNRAFNLIEKKIVSHRTIA